MNTRFGAITIYQGAPDAVKQAVEKHVSKARVPSLTAMAPTEDEAIILSGNDYYQFFGDLELEMIPFGGYHDWMVIHRDICDLQDGDAVLSDKLYQNVYDYYAKDPERDISGKPVRLFVVA
jgi:hypothetical protein